jgi:hypothetical protein
MVPRDSGWRGGIADRHKSGYVLSKTSKPRINASATPHVVLEATIAKRSLALHALIDFILIFSISHSTKTNDLHLYCWHAAGAVPNH